MRASNRSRASALRAVVARVADRGAPNEIEKYVQCALCASELPDDELPATYARFAVGLTAKGVQVWCTRHNANIAHFVFHAPAGDS